MKFRRVSRARTIAALLTAALACGAAVSCSRTATPERPNLIFILLDTLRADHLTPYGAPEARTPNLAAFAAESVVFRNATSQAACTFPSMNSLLTSRYPGEFLARAGGPLGIPDDVPSLPVIFREAGFETHAVSASPVVRNEASHFNPGGGFGAGYDSFLEHCEWRGAGCVNKAALQILKEVSGPYLLYLHYLDPHALYSPPRAYRGRRTPDYTGDQEFVGRGDPRPIEKMLYSDGPAVELGDEDIAHLKSLYADEVNYLDFEVGRLLSTLRDRGDLDRSIVVVASDHGEAFLEHDDIHHCHGLYETLVHTPLMIRFPPGGPTGDRDEVVENLDILPTLVDYFEIATGSLDFAGRSLRPVIERNTELATSSRPAFSVQGVERSIRSGEHKLIYETENGGSRLFDLAADPGETRDLTDDALSQRRELLAALERWMRDYEPEVDPEAETNVGRRLEERLKALGYLE